MLRVDRCRDMDEWLTFESDPDHSPDAGTGLLSPISYRPRNFAAALAYMLPASYAPATRNFTSGKPHICVFAARVHDARASRGFIHRVVGRRLSEVVY